MKSGWEHFEHQADIGVRGVGATPERAFEQAALAMTAVVTEPGAVRPLHEVCVRCEAPDLELLLADWLNALLREMAARRMLFGRFEVRLDGGVLEGRAWGEAVDRVRHRPAVEVKAATFAGLKVERTPQGGWVAQCVVDV